VTLRALRILRDVPLIAAEDTRRTAKLLQHYSISTRTTSLHEHNEREKTPRLLELLRGGDSIAIVSDAGTPVISDPGQTLVAAARAEGIRVESIPGPSAVMAAIAASGLPAGEFIFLGFPPTRSSDRKQWFAGLADERRLAVIFEAPHRILRTLADLGEALGEERELCLARELTKAHEELVKKPISAFLSDPPTTRGEFTILVPPGPATAAGPQPCPSPDELRVELGHLTEKHGVGRREGLKQLSKRYGVPVNALYRILEE
jgi:16S rRNA (cytidine1402-2'-O)-methyltransferase